MIFQRISYRIALQFTAFVFLLFLINGALFLFADLSNARRETGSRLLRQTQDMVQHMPTATSDSGLVALVPPPMRERVRIARADGSTIYEGAVLNGVPFEGIQGLSHFSFQGERYSLLTSAVSQNGSLVAYVQLAERERGQAGDLPERALVYVIVSVFISLLTFVVGLFFSRRSMAPAEQMMERLEQFTQDASHELRTPLAALSTSLDLALRNQKYKEGIESAKDDLKQVSVLVERLLELARLDKMVLQKERVDMTALVEESVDRYRVLAEKGNVAIDAVAEPNVVVQGDGALIRQILSNLIMNAIKFAKEGNGRITVTLTKRKLSVKDDGIGIDADSVAHIFDRFYQAENSRSNGGFGLGLALVKRIADLHGWRVEVESRVGDGAEFVVSFS